MELIRRRDLPDVFYKLYIFYGGGIKCVSQEGNSPPYLWKPGLGKNIRKAIMGDS
jgi:hypothetical protein